MMKVAIYVSALALGVAFFQAFQLLLETPMMFTPIMAFAFFAPCGLALMAYRGPVKVWFIWLAWISNLLICVPVAAASIIYVDKLISNFDLIGALKAAFVLFIAPAFNLFSLKPWRINSAAHGKRLS